ncbi:hypothetical protein RUM44_011520 [Polyplax serrata]|uniref:Uncharacterized protein n=1 Tax=Polyplax serrata TaxID=468196 RepID=A0ABR1AQD0_POLSC
MSQSLRAKDKMGEDSRVPGARWRKSKNKIKNKRKDRGILEKKGFRAGVGGYHRARAFLYRLESRPRPGSLEMLRAIPRSGGPRDGRGTMNVLNGVTRSS